MSEHDDHERVRLAGVADVIWRSDLGCGIALVLGLAALFVCVVGGALVVMGWR